MLSRFSAVFIVIFILALGGTAFWIWKRHPEIIPPTIPLINQIPSSSQESPKLAGSFEARLRKNLAHLEVREDEIRTSVFLEDTLKEIHISLPRGKPIEWLAWTLAQSAEGTSYELVDSRYHDNTSVCRMVFESRRRRDLDIILVLSRSARYFSASGKIALFIENFKYDANETVNGILTYPHPLTLSLVPGEEYTKLAVEAARKYKKEVVVHLPLESVLRQDMPNVPSGAIIKIHHSEDHIRGMMDEAMRSVPNFAGFSNYGGTRFLADSRATDIMMDELEKKGAYFLETATVRTSVAENAARSHGISYGRISSRLLPTSSVEELVQRLKHLSVIAHKRGTLIVAAQVSPALVDALHEMDDDFEANGIRLVAVSQIITREMSP